PAQQSAPYPVEYERPFAMFLKPCFTISLSPVTLTAISMNQACLYTTARLFRNCPSETKWEISGEVRKVFIHPCSLLHSAGSRLDLRFVQIY
ncbi:hypothetical protein, partial [Enterobacter chuandaensis]|uniref:hypothetical protein n=1 Tax=Enterobacter chuandaensis TaxID=2497875 RepID=UPI001C5F47B7